MCVCVCVCAGHPTNRSAVPCASGLLPVNPIQNVAEEVSETTVEPDPGWDERRAVSSGGCVVPVVAGQDQKV